MVAAEQEALVAEALRIAAAADTVAVADAKVDSHCTV
jgi:hypothetical protein